MDQFTVERFIQLELDESIYERRVYPTKPVTAWS